MEPLVSVIVPLYNCGKYIGKCITSLLGQSYCRIEVIVVNDGSTDNGGRILQHYANRDARIRYVSQPNHGVAHARNMALGMAAGEYILFVDADDYAGPDYIRDLVICAQQGHSDLVISGFTMEDERGRRMRVICPDGYERLHREIWAYRLSACCGRLYRKAFWDRYHLKFLQEKDARAEDVPLVLFANAMAENIAVLPGAEYHYVQRAGSAMHNKKRVLFLFPYKAFGAVYKRVTGMSPYNSRLFWDMGVLKFLAHFEFVIYRHAGRAEKRRFTVYVMRLLGDDYPGMALNWKQIRNRCGLPLVHRAAIDLFVLKYRVLYRTGGRQI